MGRGSHVLQRLRGEAVGSSGGPAQNRRLLHQGGPF